MQHPILLLLLLGLSLAKMDMEENREGRPSQSPNVKCGKWTNVVVEVGPMTMATYETTRQTRRCVALFKPVEDCTELQLTCTKFYVDNRDPWKCKRGDTFTTKSGDTKPRVFCKRDGPTVNFPVLSPDTTNIRVWYRNNMELMDKNRYKKKGVKCMVTCNSTN